METNKTHLTKDGIRLYQPEDFAGMAKAGALAAKLLDDIAPYVTVGQTTGELDRLITQWVEEAGAVSATIGYKGYQHASLQANAFQVVHCRYSSGDCMSSGPRLPSISCIPMT